MNAKELVILFAKSGYLLDPEVHRYLCPLPDEFVKGILTRINTVCPDTLVITFQTLSKAMGMWVMIDQVTFRKAIFYNPDFNLYHGFWESVKRGGL